MTCRHYFPDPVRRDIGLCIVAVLLTIAIGFALHAALAEPAVFLGVGE